MVVCHRLAFNDVMNGLVDNGEWHDVPLFRLSNASVHLKLYRIKQFVYQILESGSLDIGHLVGLNNLDFSKEISGLVFSISGALLNSLASKAYLIKVFDASNFRVSGECISIR